MKRTVFTLLQLLLVALFSHSQIIYLGSYPENNAEITSFQDIVLKFDISNVVEEYGEGEWGICVGTLYSPRPQQASKNKIACLYKGDENGDMLAYNSTKILPSDDDFISGNELRFSFDGISVEPGQQYTIKVTYDIFAGKKGESTWETDTKLELLSNPILITLYGAQDGISLGAIFPESYSGVSELANIKLSFDRDISINELLPKPTLSLNDEIVCVAEKVEVSDENRTNVDITFPLTTLYYKSQYIVNIPKGFFFDSEDEEITSEAISIVYDGMGYHYFDVNQRNMEPADNSTVIGLEKVYIPFKFPEGSGFVSKNEQSYIANLYADSPNGQKIGEYKFVRASNAEGIEGEISYALEADKKYVLVIPSGQIPIYNLATELLLKDWTNPEIVINIYTPSLSEIEPLSLGAIDTSLSSLENGVSFSISPYIYEDEIYVPKLRQNATILFKDVDETVECAVEIIESEEGYIMRTKTPMEVPLFENQEYAFIIPANIVAPSQTFLNRYAGNKETTVIIKGISSTLNDFGLKANIDNRLHSHADVFSFVTESEVKAGENAKMILKDGEENVAEASVYVSREANGHRVYADFGGKKLESGKSYDVVLPEGSVYASNGIVNNPEIKSAITAMPEQAAAPEFISIDLNIDEYATATYRMVKGEESVVDLKAGDDWKLENLSLNGDDVTSEVSEQGLYTLPALNEDATLDATYAYAHDITYDYTTGVGNIEDLPYSLSKDGSHVIISGLNGGENIAIYTVGGMKIASLDTVPADMHEASLALPEGQIYIIVINQTSIKWKH